MNFEIILPFQPHDAVPHTNTEYPILLRINYLEQTEQLWQWILDLTRVIYMQLIDF